MKLMNGHSREMRKDATKDLDAYGLLIEELWKFMVRSTLQNALLSSNFEFVLYMLLSVLNEILMEMDKDCALASTEYSDSILYARYRLTFKDVPLLLDVAQDVFCNQELVCAIELDECE